MKKVFTNDQCIHVYAQQTQETGKTNNGNVFFDNKIIYSYGHHFPMAVFINNETIVINDDSYSISTSQHQGALISAVNHIPNKIYVDTNVIKIIVDNVKYNKGKLTISKYDKDKLEKNALSLVDDHLRKAAKRRAPHLLISDLNNAKNELKTVYNVLELFGRKPNARIKSKLNSLENDSNNENVEQAKKKLAQIKKTIIHSANEQLKKWRKGEVNSISYKYRDFVDTELRIYDDKTIITSEGAYFPMDEAITAFRLIRTMKEKDILFVNNTNEFACKLGHYKIDKITKQGHVRAGCHFVKWPAIEKMARELEIYP